MNGGKNCHKFGLILMDKILTRFAFNCADFSCNRHFFNYFQLKLKYFYINIILPLPCILKSYQSRMLFSKKDHPKNKIFWIKFMCDFSVETKYFRERCNSALHRYYESKNHQKKQIQTGGFQDFRRDLQAVIGTRANINIAQIEDYGGETFVSEELAITLLQESKMSFQRCQVVNNFVLLETQKNYMLVKTPQKKIYLLAIYVIFFSALTTIGSARKRSSNCGDSAAASDGRTCRLRSGIRIANGSNPRNKKSASDLFPGRCQKNQRHCTLVGEVVQWQHRAFSYVSQILNV